MNSDSRQSIINAVLVDDLDKARSLINEAEGFDLLSDLAAKSVNSPPPLQWLKSDYPKFIHIPTSFTCGMACKMCNAGFHDRASQFGDRKHFLPEEFDKLHDWIETAAYVHLVGNGETLNTPHIPYFMKKIADKISIITTSGTPLNKEIIICLIQAGLHFINLSFDGTTTVGHGGGDKNYANSFWEKVKLLQDTKTEHSTHFPIPIVSVTINNENVAQLDDICAMAYRNNIQIVDLFPMYPRNPELLQNSILVNYETYSGEIGRTMSKWNPQGMKISFCNQTEVKQNSELCFFIDNYILFTGYNQSSPQICCGPLNLPFELGNYTKDVFWNSFPLRYFRYMHLSRESRQQPLACQNCLLINIKQCAQIAKALFPEIHEKNKLESLYNKASLLKQNKRPEEAERAFTKLLESPMDWTLKGKIYFHLGELAVQKSDYPQALSFMKLAVQHCFDHKLAFVYLYFLMMLFEKPQTPQPPFARTETHMEKLSQSLGILLAGHP